MYCSIGYDKSANSLLPSLACYVFCEEAYVGIWTRKLQTNEPSFVLDLVFAHRKTKTKSKRKKKTFLSYICDNVKCYTFNEIESKSDACKGVK